MEHRIIFRSHMFFHWEEERFMDKRTDQFKVSPLSVKMPNDTSALFKSILQNSKEAAIFILDKDGFIMECNPGALIHFGYSPEDINGKHFSVLYISEDKNKSVPETELQNVLKTGSSKDHNFIVHKDGHPVWSLGESILAKDSNNNKFILKIVYDLSEQKALENSLSESNELLNNVSNNLYLVNYDLHIKNEKLDKTIKDLDTFVYSASHDLKAPINNIEALVNALEQELSQENKETTAEIIKMISKSIEKFKLTINDLATVGKIQAEGNEDEEMISFQEIFEDVKLNLKEMIENSGVSFFVDFSKARTVKFSAKHLRSILQNLVSNAIKYRSPLRKPEVHIRSQEIKGYVLLEVIDNGLGIKKEDKDKVFFMYKRLHNHIEGSGVGLTIAKRMIENHGGKIDFESEVGKGSTFKVYFKR